MSNIDQLIKNTKAETMKKNFEQFLKNIKKNNLILIFENKSILDLLDINIIIKGKGFDLQNLIESKIFFITSTKEVKNNKVNSNNLS